MEGDRRGYFKRIRVLQKKKHQKRQTASAKTQASPGAVSSGCRSGATIVVENLKDIRVRMKAKRHTQTKRWMHVWPFANLRTKIVYKAEERDRTVVAVDLRHTSQRCSCCGHRARNNRCSQSVFLCRQCGFHLTADLNAARNIAATYHSSVGKFPAGGLCNQPIVSTSDSFGREVQAVRL